MDTMDWIKALLVVGGGAYIANKATGGELKKTLKEIGSKINQPSPIVKDMAGGGAVGAAGGAVYHKNKEKIHDYMGLNKAKNQEKNYQPSE